MSLEHSRDRVGEDPAISQTKVRVLPDGRMTRQDAATYIGVAPKTMAQWQVMGKLRGVRVGGRVFYFKSQLDAFVRGEEAA